MSSELPAHPKIRIGHVHLMVADLDRAVAFYRDVLGLEVTMYGPQEAGVDAAWLSAGGYHHHVALNTFESEGRGELTLTPLRGVRALRSDSPGRSRSPSPSTKPPAPRSPPLPL